MAITPHTRSGVEFSSHGVMMAFKTLWMFEFGFGLLDLCRVQPYRVERYFITIPELHKGTSVPGCLPLGHEASLGQRSLHCTVWN